MGGRRTLCVCRRNRLGRRRRGENVGEAAELDLPLAALGVAAARVREQVNEHITGNEEVQSVVQALERQYDTYVAAQEQQSTLLASDEPLPSGDELGAEFERFLAEQAGLDEGDGTTEQ